MSNIYSISLLINLFLIIFAPLFMVGVIRKTKAFFARRKGPSIWQPYYDVARLLKKGEVISLFSVNSWASSASIATLIFAALFVPQITGVAIIHNVPFDFLIFIYLLGLSRFFSVINAMQASSSFEGMGASRELVFSISSELTLILCISALAIFSNCTTFSAIFAAFSTKGIATVSIAIISSIILFVVMLIEGCRVPIDDPTTHLELTMIHEVMILDNSGVSLGYLVYGGMLKLYIFSSIICSILLAGLINSTYLYAICFAVLTILLSKIIGIIESVQARLRMVHVHQYILFAAGLGVILLISVMFMEG